MENPKVFKYLRRQDDIDMESPQEQLYTKEDCEEFQEHDLLYISSQIKKDEEKREK